MWNYIPWTQCIWNPSGNSMESIWKWYGIHLPFHGIHMDYTREGKVLHQLKHWHIPGWDESQKAPDRALAAWLTHSLPLRHACTCIEELPHCHLPPSAAVFGPFFSLDDPRTVWCSCGKFFWYSRIRWLNKSWFLKYWSFHDRQVCHSLHDHFSST